MQFCNLLFQNKRPLDFFTINHRMTNQSMQTCCSLLVCISRSKEQSSTRTQKKIPIIRSVCFFKLHYSFEKL